MLERRSVPKDLPYSVQYEYVDPPLCGLFRSMANFECHLVSTFRRTLVAAILAGSPIGCSGSPTQPPTRPSWDGQVRVAGSVLDFRTNAGIGGARVTIGD